MIGKVSGAVGYVASDHALIETAGGVGYVIYCAPRVLAGLPRSGGRAALWVETVVREDSITLFGFPTLVEKEWHRLLTSVQGVGAKASLSILDALYAEFRDPNYAAVPLLRRMVVAGHLGRKSGEGFYSY